MRVNPVVASAQKQLSFGKLVDIGPAYRHGAYIESDTIILDTQTIEHVDIKENSEKNGIKEVTIQTKMGNIFSLHKLERFKSIDDVKALLKEE